jgi:hypothetical protein
MAYGWKQSIVRFDVRELCIYMSYDWHRYICRSARHPVFAHAANILYALLLADTRGERCNLHVWRVHQTKK